MELCGPNELKEDDSVERWLEKSSLWARVFRYMWPFEHLNKTLHLLFTVYISISQSERITKPWKPFDHQTKCKRIGGGKRKGLILKAKQTVVTDSGDCVADASTFRETLTQQDALKKPTQNPNQQTTLVHQRLCEPCSKTKKPMYSEGKRSGSWRSSFSSSASITVTNWKWFRDIY